MGLWPIALREPLPKIPIPLPDRRRKVRIDLQALLNKTYDEARYGDYIYDDSPQPPLRKTDTAWAKRLIAKRK